MCGIVGLLPRVPGDPGRLETLVRRMSASIQHRGPDDSGFHVTPNIALGIQRLSIIDVAHGHQPIYNDDRSKVIVFNGEIYNYRGLRQELTREGQHFKTNSDTEVALRAVDLWGVDGISKLEGMFGLAIWDETQRRLTLARDWLGQKSIYYADTPDGFAFASEIKALLALGTVPREVDVEALSHYMSMRYLPQPRTLFVGISKVPPAHVVHASAGDLSFQRYWKPDYTQKWQGSEDEALDELDRIMHGVVDQHLMSDVPLGAFLSGGIDSSLVVAYAAQATSEPLSTFSVGVHDAAQSELPWARMVANQYKTNHFEKIMEPDLARLTPSMVAALEEPVDPFAAGVYIVSEITSRQVTVALGGDGGDELFAGYDRYVGQQLAELYAKVPAVIRKGLMRPMIRMVPESFGYKSFATKLRWMDRMADRDGVERYAESAAFLRFSHTMKSELFAPDVWRNLEKHKSERLLEEYFDDGSADEFVDRMLHIDCMTRMASHLLPIVDRMSMAHSLEVRCPLLDRRVAEFAMRIPAAWKLKKRRLKYMLRRLGERHLSRELLYRKKQGFGFPLAHWFRGELRPLLERTVRESRMVEAGFFRREPMQRILDEHLGGKIDHNYRLWLLFNVEMWYRHFIREESTDSLREWIDSSIGSSGGESRSKSDTELIARTHQVIEPTTETDHVP
jgi:asparagine synthase (glutamine-hydrolysing)